jgi:hypothetical protein
LNEQESNETAAFKGVSGSYGANAAIRAITSCKTVVDLCFVDKKG